MFLIFLMVFSMQYLAIKGELIKDPTLKDAERFDYKYDADTLSTNLLTSQTNEDKVANILFHRTYKQRKEIQVYYDANMYRVRHSRRRGTTMSKAYMINDLRYISAGSLSDLYRMLFTPFEEILADVVRKTITREWKEVGAIEEILCANDNEMKKLIQNCYEAKYNTKVEVDLKTFNKDDCPYQDAMQKYCWPRRCEELKISKEDAIKEAKALQDIDTKNDKENFKNKLKGYLKKYCEPDLKLIFEKYRKDDHGISDAVDEVFEGDEKRVYNVLVRYNENTCKYYADELNDAVKGFGKDIDKVNRIIVTRCERDLLCILNNFKSRHGKTFTNRLKSEVVGEPRYLKSIRYLCGKP